MQNAELEDSQTGIKIARRNINNLRYADDNTLMAESKEELKSPLMRVWEWKKRVKKIAYNSIIKNEDHACGPITSWQIGGEKVETVTNFIFLGSKTTVEDDCSHEIKRHLFVGRKAMTNLDTY